MNLFNRSLVNYLVAVAILVLLICIFLSPTLSGKVLIQSDAVGNLGINAEADAYFKKNGTYTLWTNNMFGGMPTYASYGSASKPSLTNYFVSFLGLFEGGTLGYFIYFGLMCFLGFVCLGVGPWIALIGSIAASFATVHIDTLEAGHNSKLASACAAVLVFASLYRLHKREYLIGGLSFLMGFTFSLITNHPQMTYYILLAYGLGFIFIAIDFIQQKWYKPLGIVTGILVLSTLLGLGANFYQLKVLNGYAKYTMRGGSILSRPLDSPDASSSASGKSGLGYDYAMQWSNNWADLWSMIIPRATGGSSNEFIRNNSKAQAALTKAGIGRQDALPLYWGDLPFTGAPPYIGIVVALLFIIGSFTVKGWFKWALIAPVLLLILMSLGKHFGLNEFLFNTIPYLNKFRTPNSIMNVTSCIIPILAFLALHLMTHNHWSMEEKDSIIKKIILPFNIVLVLLILFGSSLFSFTGIGDGRYEAGVINVFKDIRAQLFRADGLRSSLFSILASAAIFFYFKNKLKTIQFIAILGTLTLIDLMGIAKRYVRVDEFKPKSAMQTTIPKRPVDDQILQDPQKYYRVFDMSSGDPFQNSSASYFHKSVGGYHPAKLRRYQDMISQYISKGNMNVLNMLNTKYIIDSKGQLQTNPAALGNAWFVTELKSVLSPDDEFFNLATTNPASSALILSSEFKGYDQSNFAPGGTITLTTYDADKLSYQSQNAAEGLAVFSDIWFPGWQAYIDGKKVDHVRANYILRALKIPAGNHTIDFKFEPTAVYAAGWINAIFSFIVGLLILGLTYYLIRNYKPARDEHEKLNPKVVPISVKQSVKQNKKK